MRSLTHLFILALLAAVLLGALPRQTAKVVLTGKVQYKGTLRPVEGATLKIYQLIEGPDLPLIDTARTNAKGEYAMNIPQGQRFRLTATAAGLESSSVFVSTENLDTRSFGAVVKQDLVLGPKGEH
jgi:hypothetical protein